jgi:hypothetical protein
MYLRLQTVIYLDDLSTDFLEATMSVWNDQGIDAARCFSLGA